ncbi:restriction endonuclease [Streptomyces albidoflavus]
MIVIVDPSRGDVLSNISDQPDDQSAENARRPHQGFAVEDAFEITRGFATSASAPGACPAQSAGAVRLVWIKHVGRDGSIAEPDAEADIWRDDVPERFHLRAGDILLSEVVTGRPKAACVQESDLPAAAAGSVYVLRPKSALSPEHTRLILAFLRSESVARLAYGDFGRSRIRRADLSPLELPEPDEALATALNELDSAGLRMRRWSAEANALAGSVFETEQSLDEARRSIIEAGQLIRLRAEAAGELDDPDYTVRTRFPYPVALRLREAEARRSTGDLEPAYGAVLDAAETLLAYTALVAGALARDAAIDLSSLGLLQRKLAGTAGGPGLGEWTAILQEVAGAKKRRGLNPDHPLHELANLAPAGEAQQARSRLAARRNDKAHGRMPDVVELPQALQEASDDLALLVSRARFLADLPLIHVTSVVWDAFRRQASISYRRLMGDHPVVPTLTMHYPSNAVETGSLYVVGRDHHLYLLRPFLTCEVCETCRTWSTFHGDKVKGQLVQKSLEHGHHYAYRADAEVLRQTGLM